MKRWCCTTLFVLSNVLLPAQQTNYCDFVNPMIGTGGHGHTFPGAVLPFGMVQLSPDTRVDGSWDGCSGYHYSDTLIYGFSHTHLSGTGASDWGDILLMPVTEIQSLDNKMYASAFSHKSEKAGAGYYEVCLKKDNIKCEMTSTLRTGIHRYTFQKNKKQAIVLDLLHRDKTLDCDLQVIDSVTVGGYRLSEAWAQRQYIYFIAKFSKPFKKIRYAVKKDLQAGGKRVAGEKVNGAAFEFGTGDGIVMVKVAISGVDEAGALKNLEAEALHWDFVKYRSDACEAWNNELRKIELNDPDKDKMKVFYTALYHCFIHPSLNMDTDRRYRGRDNEIHAADGFTNYSVFSLWDTYRALNPLFTILQTERTADFINTFIAQHQQTGRLPVWELSGNETDCMIGFHSVSVIADAITKNIGGFDKQLAYDAMKAASNYTGFSIPVFNKNGFLQVDDESESVSKTLEYGYDNWCIARVAQVLGKKEDAQWYLRRSQAFRNIFDDSTHFMRPRKNGNWLSPFYPTEINNHFTEGNSWQYSFYVPHSVNALIALHGGKNNFEKKLDELFQTHEKTRGRDQADVTGLIGQYAHGNEPSHHMAYLYNYVDRPEKTAARVSQICRDFYKNLPDGLIGNEDCGQMSAWYIFSAIGMYPLCPGSTDYVLGIPAFREIKLNLAGGRFFSVSSKPAPGQVLTGITLNGRSYLRSAISHNLVTDGGELRFISGDRDTAREKYGTGVYAVFSRNPAQQAIIPAPLLRSSSQVFKDHTLVTISKLGNEAVEIYYTDNGSEPYRTSKKYTAPVDVRSNMTLKARAYSRDDSSSVTTAVFYKIKYDYNISISSKANAQYAAEGAQSLIDGINGSVNWRKGDWLGYQGQDFECVVDLKGSKQVSSITLSALQDTRSWIVFPTEVHFFGSTDGKTFTPLAKASVPVQPADLEPQLYKFESSLPEKKTFRYLKVQARNFGRLPEWHQGSGGDAFIFVDELEIK